MMNAKDLERLVEGAGGNASAFDVVTRKLRESFKVSTTGRGINAHHLEPSEASWLLVAYAASDVAARAASRFGMLVNAGMPQFWSDIQEMITVPGVAERVKEVRVSRTSASVTVVYRDGTEARHGEPMADVSIDIQGVISGGLLIAVRAAMRSEA